MICVLAPDEKQQKLREKEREKQLKMKKRTAKQSKNKKDEEEALREGVRVAPKPLFNVVCMCV